MDRITIHELATGMNHMGRTDPFDDILSVFDRGPPRSMKTGSQNMIIRCYYSYTIGQAEY